MGRPLRARYANTTYVDGVQEMSNTDISSLIVPLISQYLVDNYSNPASIGLGQTLTIQLGNPTWGSNVSSRGNIRDTKAATLWGAPVVIGDHPVTNTNSFGVSLWQNLNTADPFTAPADLGANRPLQTVSSGGARRIQSMTDTEIENDIVSNVVSTMITGGLGAYWLGTTAPVDGGTWVVRSSILYDTYNGPSGEITTNYYLWQKTATGGSIGTIRPLKRSANNQLQEMSNTDIVNLASHIRKYTVNTGIGLYSIGPSAPGEGTWISRGSFVDTRNVLSDDSYSGSYLGSFTGSFTGVYTGSYSRVFTGVYSGIYSRSFSGIYVGGYGNGFTGTFSGIYSGAFTGAFSGGFTGQFSGFYAGSYAGQYSNQFTGTFTGGFTGGFAGSYSRTWTAVFAGTYNAVNPFSGGITGSFTGSYVANYVGTYTGIYNNTFQNSFSKLFTGSFTGVYTGLYTGVYSKEFTGSYNQAFTNTFTGSYNQVFSRIFTGSYQGFYVGSFSGLYTGDYTGNFTGLYSGTYNNNFTRLFTGAYSGLTVTSSLVTTTYTLWVRIA